VRAYTDVISHYSKDQAAKLSDQAKELFDILIRPASHLLSSGKTICIVPDKILAILPFETLISPCTETYLLESWAISYCPSSSVLVACINEAKHKTSFPSEKLLGVGNPTFDPSLFNQLSTLPAAEMEVNRIAEYYENKVILTTNGAAEAKVRREMQAAHVIHLATHSVLDSDSPLRSRILLTKGRRGKGAEADGILESYEIYEMQLPYTRLAVLPSCQSGIDRYYKGEGMMSLARSFMAAGVPTVMASLWKVDSNPTADLMIEFHRLKQQERLSVVEALRQAKLRMLKGQDDRFRQPYFWSAFVVLGAEASS
jgi:CHAT domain-containing protein